MLFHYLEIKSNCEKNVCFEKEKEKEKDSNGKRGKCVHFKKKINMSTNKLNSSLLCSFVDFIYFYFFGGFLVNPHQR